MVTAVGGFPPLPDFPPIPRPDFLHEKYSADILEDTKKRAEEIYDHEIKKWLENFEAKK